MSDDGDGRKWKIALAALAAVVIPALGLIALGALDWLAMQDPQPVAEVPPGTRLGRLPASAGGRRH